MLLLCRKIPYVRGCNRGLSKRKRGGGHFDGERRGLEFIQPLETHYIGETSSEGRFMQHRDSSHVGFLQEHGGIG